MQKDQEKHGHLKRRKIFLYSVGSWYAARAPPLLKFGFTSYQISEESKVTILHTRYFRKKDPLSEAQPVEWVEMSGKEYYHFVTDPANKGRQFIDMGDVVLEATEGEVREYTSGKNHNYYIRSLENGWSTLSLYSMIDKNGCSGEEVVDEAQDVESQAMAHIECEALHKALICLDTASQRMIYDLYLAASGREICRQDVRIEMVNRLLCFPS